MTRFPKELDHEVPRADKKNMTIEKHEQIYDKSSKAVLDRITIICAVLTIIISTIILSGWFFNLFDISRSNPIYKPMSPSSSISFIVLGCALLVYFYLPINHTGRKLAKVAVVLILAFDLIILVDFIIGYGFNIERFILPHPQFINNVIIGWMSPIAAVNFVISGLALLLLLFSREGKHRTESIAAYLASFSLYIGIIVLIGYFYRTPLFYGASTIPTSLFTAITFLFLSVGLITSAGIEYLPLRLFIGDSVRARLMRSFIPVIFAYIVLEGVLKILLLPYSDENVLHSSIMIIFFFVIGGLITSRIAQTVGGDIDRQELIQRERDAYALHESESKFRKIFETVPDGLGLTRLKDGLLIEANNGLSQMFGYTKDELIGKTTRELNFWVDPGDRNRMLEQLQSRDFANGMEVKYRKKNGEISLGMYSAAKLLINNELHLIISTRDISQRKQAENLLRIQKDIASSLSVSGDMNIMLDRILKAVSQIEGIDSGGIYISDRLTGDLILRAHYGFSSEFIRAVAHYAPDTTQWQLIQAGQPTYLKYSNARVEMRPEARKPEGLRGVAIIPVVQQGRVIGSFNMASHTLNEISINTRIILETIAGQLGEVIALMEAEEQLKDTKNYLDTIIKSSYDSIFVIDEEGRFEFGNEAFFKTMDYPEKEIMGQSFMKVIHTDYQAIVLSRWDEVQRREGKPYEVDIVRKDGTLRSLSVSHTDMEIAGKRKYCVIAKDITQLKLADSERVQLIEREQKALAEVEAARKLDIMKSMFIASTSHELRTPLNSIIGFSSLILAGLSGELNPEQKMQIEIVHSSAKHLLALISDVIDLSKIEAGKIDVNISQFDLREIVDEVLSTLGSSIKEKGLDVSVEVENIHMKTDRMRLLQCILNFVGNAVKYTENGSIKVCAKKRDNNVEISVTDTGIGIKTEDIPRLFEPFVRLESPLTLKTSGTGLGLYLTNKLARDFLRGDIDVKSEHGKGSTFILKIPVDISMQKDHENTGS